MRFYLTWPVLVVCLMAAGCEPDSSTTNGMGTSTTIITGPPRANERVDVDVSPGGGVRVDTDADAVPGDKPVEVDVQPGGGVQVDVNPGEIGERVRERREERQEAAETP